MLALRRQHVNPAVFTLYRDPLMIVEGKMQYLFDETGRRYLDLFAGIATVSCGHCHPKVVRRVQEQMETLQHTTTIYLHPNLPLLAQKLASKMPPGLDVTYFVNSGSEANDLAVTMARLFTGNLGRDRGAKRVSRRLAQLARTDLTPHLEVSPARAARGASCALPRSGAEPAHRHAGGDRLGERGRHPGADSLFDPGKIAAFIAEPIQGVGGVTRGAPNYFREAYAIAREHGGLCIADEVQTGFGRTGEHYWGFQNYGVTPDIVTMAKGIGNGVPLAAVTTRREIAEALTRRIHFNTFGGNPCPWPRGWRCWMSSMRRICRRTPGRSAAGFCGDCGGFKGVTRWWVMCGDWASCSGVELADPVTRAPATGTDARSA